MVIEDFSAQLPDETASTEVESGGRKHHSIRLASPLDRLAAAVVDFFIVVIPVATLVVAPFRKGIMKALILQNETEFFLFLGLFILGAGLVVIVYQTLMVWLFGATLGKMFWGLRVERLWKHRLPTFSSSLIRSIFWLADSLLLFVPHLSVFSNEKRRPFHDRVADTVVVTIKNRGVRAPGVIEASFVHGVIAAFVIFALVLLSFNTFEMYMQSKQTDELVESLEEEGALCKAIGVAVEDWPAEGVNDKADRLEVAMALFAAGEVAKSCLAGEVDLVLVRQGVESPLAYLAKSFVHADDAELSDRYLAQVCKLDEESDSCKMSRIVEMWTDEKWTDVGNMFKDLETTQEHYIFVWAVRHFVRREDFKSATAFLDKIDPRRALGPFVGIQRAKTYWGLKKKIEARAAAEIAFDTMGPAERIDLASWLCGEELNQSCEAVNSSSCRVMKKTLDQTSEYLTDGKVALAYIKFATCGEDDSIELVKRNVKLPEARKMVTALNLYKKGKLAEARSKMWEMIEDDEVMSDYREEARQFIANWSESVEDLLALNSDWASSEVGPTWRHRGESLFRNYYRLKSYSEAWSIGERIHKEARLDSQLLEDMVVAAFYSGHKREALTHLSQARPDFLAMTPDRGPASSSPFLSVVKQLVREKSTE